MLNIKVINAGNCMICGRKIKIVTKKKNNIFPDIFFCPKCEKQIEKDYAESQERQEK